MWRLYDKRQKATADLLALAEENPQTADSLVLHHPSNHTKYRVVTKDEISAVEPLLVDIMVEGKVVYDLPSIEEMRAVREQDMERLDHGVKRLMTPHIYHVSLSQKLWDLKQGMIQAVNGEEE